MRYTFLADVVVVVHLLFVAFVLFGGVLVWRWTRLGLIHIPAVVWGVLIEWTGGVCPLTPLENWLRREAGASGYSTDFLGRYLLPLLYPDGLTRSMQLILGGAVVAVNAAAYARFWVRREGRRL